MQIILLIWIKKLNINIIVQFILDRNLINRKNNFIFNNEKYKNKNRKYNYSNLKY